MSMPWLQPRKKTVSVLDANPDGSMKKMEEIPEELVMAAEEFLSAIARKDAKDVAYALQACFQLCDAEPHVEGEHLETE